MEAAVDVDVAVVVVVAVVLLQRRPLEVGPWMCCFKNNLRTHLGTIEGKFKNK